MSEEATPCGPLQRIVSLQPTHWMDPILKRTVSDEFMRSEKAHGDYQGAYSVPCVKRNGKITPIAELQANAVLSGRAPQGTD